MGAAAIGYAAGTLPSADLIARGVDIRTTGSGNPGAANVADVIGKKAGAVVFGLDMGKALAAARLAATFAGPVGANVAGAAAVIGHCFPAQRGFDGGKGVAASFGQMLATFPAYLPVDLALGAVAARSDFWKQRPVATISATCALWVGCAATWRRHGLANLWAGPASGATVAGAAVSSAAIVYRFAQSAGPPDGADPTPPASKSEGPPQRAPQVEE